MMKGFSLILALSLYGTQSNGFSSNPQSNTPNSLLLLKEHHAQQPQQQESSSSSINRRHWMKSSFQNILLIGGGIFSQTHPSSVAHAVMSVDQKVFTPGESLSIEASKERFVLARKDVQYLLDHYDAIAKEGGDAVRRYLGTVGVAGAMYGISKVVKNLREEAEDIVEYTEAMDEFNAYLYQAEGAAYQSIFAEHSSAKATPESCLATAKQDVIMMAKYMDQLKGQLNL